MQRSSISNTTPSVTSGNLDALRGMKLTMLNLTGCSKITGTSVGAVGSELKCCPRASPNAFLQCSSSSNTIPSVTSGDLSALAGAPIKKLNLTRCPKITGTSVGAVGLELRCCPRASPNAFLQCSLIY